MKTTNKMDRAKGLTPINEVFSRAASCFEGIRGTVTLTSFAGSISAEIGRGGESLYVTSSADDAGPEVVNPDDPTERIQPLTVTFTLTWSSTARTLASATAAISLYQEVVARVAEAEALAQRWRGARFKTGGAK
jgi:hypothetical protein